jgi:hypothetical protein
MGPPTPTPFAIPFLAPTVATSVFDELHVDCVVTSFVELSENVPVAVNACIPPTAIFAVLGVTAIDFSVGPAAVNVAVTVSVAAGIVNVQVEPATVHEVGAPFHPANVEPFVTPCVNTT